MHKPGDSWCNEMMRDCGPEPETKENGMTQVTGWGRPATSSPAASGAVLSPSHPWRKDDPGGGFPSLKQTLDPSVTCVLTQRGCSIQFTSELLGKIHKCQAVPFCLVKKGILKSSDGGSFSPASDLRPVRQCHAALLLTEQPWHFARGLCALVLSSRATPGPKDHCKHNVQVGTAAPIVNPSSPVAS